ncbi:hypothetical protein LOD99_6624 [Oopsacas minuta]|uniref:Cadherin domain-containing protein n=1 Tax=Oopsacas minuta TaxID=111878 RepID=A0AAV7JL56_9METZ|nr:hypothetical protein LOD99_6624 [Oopsacas minuta]
MRRIPTVFAILCTYYMLLPVITSQSTAIPGPTQLPSLTCSDNIRQQCIQVYNDNITNYYPMSNFSQVYLQICEISQLVTYTLCAYTSFLVSCIYNEISSVILPGIDSRNLDANARNILLSCAANTTSLPRNENILSNFAVTIKSLGYYGYFINQGLFSNIPFLANFTNLVLREINSLCVSNAANSQIVNSTSLAMYIDQLNVANLSEITCTLYCPTCPTRLVSTDGDDVISVQELCVSISNTSLVMNCPCGDGIVGIGEVCDDGNLVIGDGCSNECSIEISWTCVTSMQLSRCSNCGNGIVEFEEQCDHDDTGCVVCMIGSLFNCDVYDDVVGFTNCSEVVLDTNTADPGSVDSMYSTAENIFRLTLDLIEVHDFEYTVNYTLIFSKIDNPEINTQTNPVAVNAIRLRENLGLATLDLEPTLRITEGDLFVTTYEIDDNFLTNNGRTPGNFRLCLLAFINATEITLTDRPVGSQVRVQIEVTSTNPQEDNAPIVTGSASIFITSIGIDDTAPVITLPAYSPVFYEGNMSIAIVSPLSTIIDVNDQLYLIQSLEIILTDTPDTAQFEWISIENISSIFTVNFDNETRTLNITGPGSSENYTDILRSVVYRNTRSEPTAGDRQLFIVARDTVQASVTRWQTLSVVNVNDLPVITQSRTEDVFIENSNAILLDELIEITDEDPGAFIQYASIQFNAIDIGYEIISVSAGTQNILPANGTLLETTAGLDIGIVQNIFRGISYIHLSDDPTSGARVIQFTVVDDNSAEVSVDFTIDVQAVNDRPVVTLSSTFVTYQENSPPILIGNLITLSDVDNSNFLRMRFEIVDIPFVNYFQNELLFNGTSNIVLSDGVSLVDEQYTAFFILINNRDISEYQAITNSVRYSNIYDGDFTAIDGNRTLRITVSDLDNFPSLPVELTIQLVATNDPPLLDIGSGLGMNWTFEFTEFNGSSLDNPSNEEHIVLLPFLEIFDEENDTIASLSATLVVANGGLDPNEYVFIRSPELGLFDNSSNIQSYSTGQFLLFYGNGSAKNYTDILRALFYTNDENEPSLFPLGDRFVVITITDVKGASSSVYSIIDTIPINDNKPIVYIRLHPGQSEVLTRTPREIAAFDALNVTAFITSRIPYSNTILTTGDSVEIQFEDDVIQLNLAHWKQLEALLHFNQEVYNELPKYSYWKDPRTLTILFPRIDGHYSPRISDSQKFNLSIIFRDCKLPYKQCVNVCTKKSPLACAKGEIPVIVSSANPKIGNPTLETLNTHFPAFLKYLLISIFIIGFISMFICILHALLSGKQTIEIQQKDSKIPKKVFHHIQPKTDEEQAQSLKERKYQQIKSNPRATPNILNIVLGEN